MTPYVRFGDALPLLRRAIVSLPSRCARPARQ